MKPANKVEQPAAERSVAEPTAAESVEQRAGTKGNADQQSTCLTQSWTSVSQALERIRKVARERKKEKFTALFHHINTELLEEAFYELAQNAAPGVDRLTWKDYEADLERNIEDLHERVQRGAYRALPSRRVYIPKADGRQRPLAVAALEDKIVQRAVAALLNAIYEEDFLGFSYGFRPGRGAHDALDALCVGIHSRKVSFILDADIRSFFDEISQEWLIRFLEHRIGDRRIIRLIQKWLKAGVLEDGVVSISDRGTGQGSVISPLLANIYLHYALDLWAARWRQRVATGDMVIVRYADDFIVGFQHNSDARLFLEQMRERLGKFALSLHPEKTRLIEFGRFAAERRKRAGLGKPETFNFLGFTFICGKTRAGKFQIKRKTRADRMRAKLQEIKQEMRRRMHRPIPEQGKWLGRVVRGYFNYHAVPSNGRALEVFRHHVTDLWRRTLRRRSQRDRITWTRMTQLVEAWLPKPIILHPWPSDRFAVTHPRWEPYAGKPHVRFWCSEASCHSSGCKSRQQRSPVAVVVISSNGKGDRPVESLEVKALGGRAYRSDPYGRASNLTGRSKCVNREAPKDVPRAKRIAGRLGVPSRSDLGEGNVDIDVLDQTMIELPGVREGGMPGRNGQRKPGTTRGSPRRSRTAKALRISRHAVKSQCARGWGGWGRLSDDGPRQHNLDQSEDPWGGGLPHLHGGAPSNARPDTAREYRTPRGAQTADANRTSATRMPGAGLSWLVAGRRRPTCQPSSRIGENPPYGMIGGIEETSASFEARSAPRSYPTAGGAR
jgi:group II intron reverse transcriptase/maturase